MLRGLDNSIVVSKKVVIEKLIENRQSHIEKYDEAYKGWRIEVKEKLEKEMQKLESGGDPSLHFSQLSKPKSHEEEYNLVIEMLQMETRETIELSADEFQKFVKDKWDFSDHWITSNSMYIEKFKSS